MRNLFLLGLMHGAALVASAQTSSLDRLPLTPDDVLRNNTEVQTLEIDLHSLRIQMPRDQFIGIQNEAAATNTGAANAPREEIIEIDLEAYTRKPIGSASKL